jgi:predicted O-methyltransferase YrrM
MTWYRLKSFFAFLFSSTNQYGVHPPFLYRFITRCLYAKISKPELQALKSARQPILQSNETITMQDFGAGSQKFSTVERSVSRVAKKAGMPLHQSKLMQKITDYFNVKSALELGTSVGLGSIAMSCNRPTLNLDTVDACPNTSAIAQQHFQELNLRNISVCNTEFKSFLKHLPQDKIYDLIYLDGHHEKEGTLAYIKKLKKHIHKDSVVIIDDIYWSADMEGVWQNLCEDKDVKLSLDLYFWGILFFKPELSKQHFKIRCFY